ncbi:hypothetical protein E4T45_05507 [Aureobasidium sp. EXF-8846]|nr:hypothetical protein E4T45_05507 [Aureobasidium sp. EXF-8846]
MKKHIRCYLRAPCPWNTPHDLTTDDGTILCRKDERPLGWMMPANKQGELFRHLVIPPIAKLYPDLFVEPDLDAQIHQDQPNTYGRFNFAPFVVRKEVLIRMIEICAHDMRASPCLRDADTEAESLTLQLKRQLIKPFDFAHIKAVATPPPPAGLPKVKPDLEVAPSDSDKRKSVSEIIRRGPSTVAELLEQERAVRARVRRNSTSSSTSVDTPTRGERVDREIVEKRRLLIRNMQSWTRKRDVAHFFAGYYVGAITAPVKFKGASYCFVNFGTREQAQRAMEAMDGLPMLGREVEIELAQANSSVYEENQHPSPVKSMVATRRASQF